MSENKKVDRHRSGERTAARNGFERLQYWYEPIMPVMNKRYD
ncbi:MAG: hypothetical protein ACFFD4_04010 [Candidatus Odinarchaeota archaeon]